MSTKSKIAHTFTHMGLKVNLYEDDEGGEMNITMSVPLIEAWLNRDPNIDEIGEVWIQGWQNFSIEELKVNLGEFLYDVLAKYKFEKYAEAPQWLVDMADQYEAEQGRECNDELSGEAQQWLIDRAEQGHECNDELDVCPDCEAQVQQHEGVQ